MFIDFLFHLRAHGLDVTATEWLTLMRAMELGHSRGSLSVFYHLARAIVVKQESEYDAYDRAFGSYFEGVDEQFDIHEELLDWLADPVLPRELTPEERSLLEAMDLDTLREEFRKRLEEQKERHDGGNRWVGTGGTSPFGQGGTNPQGIRVGGSGGQRTAVQVATERRYRNLRSDRVLDTRSIGAALRRLRRLARTGNDLELDIDLTIDKTAREGGEIDLVFAPPRANRVKLLLLIDVGGSMDPHADLCERLFSAAHAHSHFKAFESYFFHNCPYDTVYSDFEQLEGLSTEDLIRKVDPSWTLIFVGDAYMHPFELTEPGGAIFLGHDNGKTGSAWLRRLREAVPNSIWLNPESRRIWDAPSIRMIREVFPMFELTLDGLKDGVDVLRGAKANRPDGSRVNPHGRWAP